MTVLFWRLPGPAAFAERIHHDLADNRSVVALLSEAAPEGLLYEIQDGVEKGGMAWRQIFQSPGHMAPARFLAEQYGCTLPNSATAGDFHGLPEAAGHTLVLELPEDRRTLTAWAEFLESYSLISRASENLWAPRFLILWPSLHECLPKQDLRLAVHSWNGSVDSTDIQLYAALLVRRTHHSPFHRNLASAVAAKVSGGDPVLCHELCGYSLPELMNPMEILKSFAERKGWGAGTVPSERDGSIIAIDGTQKTHPALSALQGKDGDIASLVWSAQVGVLMPLIEERRQEIVEKTIDRLQIPQDLPFWQSVTDVRDLEIGSISYQFSIQKGHIPRALKDQVCILKRVRDDLSHRRSLPADILLDTSTIRALTKTVC